MKAASPQAQRTQASPTTPEGWELAANRAMRQTMRPLLLSATLACGLMRDAAAASDAARFRAFEDQFFYLYSQTNMSGFTCQMSLNTINELVVGLQAKIDAGELPMDMKDSLPSFAVTYTRLGDRLEFKRPSLSLAIRDGAEIASKERLRQGMDLIFSGFNAQVDMAIGLSQGLLHEFLISRHDVISDVSFEATEGGYSVQFSTDGGATQTRFDGTTKHSVIQLPSGQMLAAAHFAPGLGGRLILQGAQVQQPDGSALKMAFIGQDVSGYLLPAAIHVKAAAQDESGGFTVTFSGCEVK